MSGPTPAERNIASQRVELRTLRERRRRVWRNLLIIALVSAVMVVLTAMNRDEAAIDTCWNRMVSVQKAFQEAYDNGQPPPPLLRPSEAAGEASEKWKQLLHYDHTRYNVLFDPQGTAKVGVCCCWWPHTRMLGSSGRHVLVFKNGEYQLEWMDEAAFRQRADGLGLRDPSDR